MAAPDDSAARLARLLAQPRKVGEASFFGVDAQLRRVAVKVLPGEYVVAREDLPIMTTLCSCIASCLWDRIVNVGGMHHFMLSDGPGDNGRYGAFAMERLIDGLLAYLRTERMPVVGMDVLDVHPRKPRFVPSSGKAMVRRRASAPAAERVERERAINPRVVMAGWADLF